MKMQFNIFIGICIIHVFNPTLVILVNTLEYKNCYDKLMNRINSENKNRINSEDKLSMSSDSEYFTCSDNEPSSYSDSEHSVIFGEGIDDEIKKCEEILCSKIINTSDLINISNILTDDLMKVFVESLNDHEKFVNMYDVYYFAFKIKKPDSNFDNILQESVQYFNDFNNLDVNLANVRKYLANINGKIEDNLDNMITVWASCH
ncbi:uncharacterized protein LOC126896776 isoform X3 [Daktulosphaira vitifoliae]|uniref:uncharacterized protein LOC126896776 isoform X3 n=1 Tax=Daktulosphaira vitifoliae TaxID=58002 RepID=UPI0021AA1B77|nr:uncharacterized protein LOC126896776 isoform X3 [Daktulosphaira vitifoliae]